MFRLRGVDLLGFRFSAHILFGRYQCNIAQRCWVYRQRVTGEITHFHGQSFAAADLPIYGSRSGEGCTEDNARGGA